MPVTNSSSRSLPKWVFHVVVRWWIRPPPADGGGTRARADHLRRVPAAASWWVPTRADPEAGVVCSKPGALVVDIEPMWTRTPTRMLSSILATPPTVLPSTSTTNCSRKCLNDHLKPSRLDTSQPLIPFCTGDVCPALAPSAFYLQVIVAPMLCCCYWCCRRRLSPAHKHDMTLLRATAIRPPLCTCHRARFLCRSDSCCIHTRCPGKVESPSLYGCIYHHAFILVRPLHAIFFIIACLTFF
jgi:hypothetical protein